MIEVVRQDIDKERGEWDEEIEINERRLITVSRRVHFRTGEKTVTINWSSIGTVNVQTAEEFARGMEIAIRIARDKNRE